MHEWNKPVYLCLRSRAASDPVRYFFLLLPTLLPLALLPLVSSELPKMRSLDKAYGLLPTVTLNSVPL